jgi:hypothetical protein
MADGQQIDYLQDPADPRLEVMVGVAANGTKRIAIIRTSDRTQFRSCRRRWGWQSHLRQGLGQKEHASPLWLGSGMHYGLEDFHGPKIYPSATDAFLAYTEATRGNRHSVALPIDLDDLIELGAAMLDYYERFWLSNRDPLQTYIYKGQYQVEVNAIVPIDMGLLPGWAKDSYDEIWYSLTFDRVIVDDQDRLWIVEYKSAKRMETRHYETDPQVSAYCWAGSHVYGRPIEGVIYQQHLKTIPRAPRILANGTISVDQRQQTTRAMYRAALIQLYGNDTAKWPSRNVDMLNHLGYVEDETKDIFVRRDRIRRNEHFCQAEGEKIVMELEEILDPDVALYPNPSRFHCYFCPFQNACINMDDGSDFEYELEQFFQPRPTVYDSWRQHLPPPEIPLIRPPSLLPKQLLLPSQLHQ